MTVCYHSVLKHKELLTAMKSRSEGDDLKTFEAAEVENQTVMDKLGVEEKMEKEVMLQDEVLEMMGEDGESEELFVGM